MQALTFWKNLPRQIASDLRRFFPGCHIRDWHQGRMSSFELMELFGVVIEDDPEREERTIRVEYAPENGAVDKALRDNGYSLLEQMVAQTHNELVRFRRDWRMRYGAKDYEPFLFVDPRVAEEREKARREQEELQLEVEMELAANVPWIREEAGPSLSM